jgi:hypothetical protein
MNDLLCIDIFNSLINQHTQFSLKKNEVGSFKRTLLKLYKNNSGNKITQISHFYKIYNIIEISGSFPAFRPRFAGKCDRQFSDLTQFISGYNLLLDRHVRTHT